MRPVDVFHIGPQKSGTTWIYRCLQEHPEIACPPRDSVHYFDMYYSRGREWYAEHFRHAGETQKLVDPTPSYIRSTWAPRRIARENPRARIALCMRNPLERAFSHYWHEKKKGKYNFEFAEVLVNYDLFSSWIEPGFYAEHVERFLEHFPREQLLCQLYDDMQQDPATFLRRLLSFIEVDPGFEPSMLHRRVNVAGTRRGLLHSRLLPKVRGALRRLRLLPALARRAEDSALLSGKSEYQRGVPPETRGPLWEFCEPEVRRLESLLGIDLGRWRPAAEPGRPATARHAGS